MTNIYKWHPRGICPECAWSAYAPFGSIFHIPIDCCPECGRKKYDGHHLASLYQTLKEWEVHTMRWVSTYKIFSLSTWGTGHWETLNQSKDTQS